MMFFVLHWKTAMKIFIALNSPAINKIIATRIRIDMQNKVLEVKSFFSMENSNFQRVGLEGIPQAHQKQ